jgi:hypothetical protein
VPTLPDSDLETSRPNSSRSSASARSPSEASGIYHSAQRSPVPSSDTYHSVQSTLSRTLFDSDDYRRRQQHMMSDDEETLAESVIDSMHSCFDTLNDSEADRTLQGKEGDEGDDTDVEDDPLSGNKSPRPNEGKFILIISMFYVHASVQY